MAVDFDPTDRALASDPLPVFRRLQVDDPVHWSERAGAWYLTRYADVQALLHDGRFSSALPGRELRDPGRMLRLALVFSDPPDHTRLRRLANKAFTPRMVERLRSRIEAVAAGLLDGIEGRSEVDIVAAFAYPLPITVIGEMLGVPSEQWDRFRAGAEGFLRSSDLGEAAWESLPAGEREAIVAALADYRACVSELIAERRLRPRDDLMSALIAVDEAGEGLTEGELTSLCGELILAGHATTASLLGLGLLALFEHPDQLERLRRNAVPIEPAVEELLRYTSPATMVGRRTTAEVEIGGRTIRAGEVVLSLLPAANRDPAVFEDPDSLDLARTPNPHLAFAHGIHFCLGAPLSRLEAQVAFPLLLQRFPHLRPAGAPVHAPQLAVRTLEHLPVATA